MARVLGIDVGTRRVGLAVSDPTGTIARPLLTLTVTGDGDAVRQVRQEIDRLRGEADGLAAVVVGLPLKLDGSASDATARVESFIKVLAGQTSLPIVSTDERLTSREAESRLALQEPDWRRRKEKLDAAAAAVILQDYLDQSRAQFGGNSAS
jgi:putative Holliday junction resolvase